MEVKSVRETLSVREFVLCLALFGEQVRHIQAGTQKPVAKG